MSLLSGFEIGEDGLGGFLATVHGAMDAAGLGVFAREEEARCGRRIRGQGCEDARRLLKLGEGDTVGGEVAHAGEILAREPGRQFGATARGQRIVIQVAGI